MKKFLGIATLSSTLLLGGLADSADSANAFQTNDSINLTAQPIQINEINEDTPINENERANHCLFGHCCC